jgi:hypothetical protein
MSQTGLFSVWESSGTSTTAGGFTTMYPGNFSPTVFLATSDVYLPFSFSAVPEPQNVGHLGLEHLPEPGVLLSFGPGLMLLAWLDHRRRRRAIVL